MIKKILLSLYFLNTVNISNTSHASKMLDIVLSLEKTFVHF